MSRDDHLMNEQTSWIRYFSRLIHRVYYRTVWTHHHVANTFVPRPSNYFRPHALRRPMLHVYAGVIVAIKIITVAAVSLYASQARLSDVTPSVVVSLTNKARLEHQVAALKTNPLLTKAAESKANDMVSQEYFAHISPNGITPWNWFKQAGYAYTYAGENLAIDYIQSEDVITAWLDSPSHRRNLLSTKFRDIGVATATGKINGATSLIVVQMFGAPSPKPTIKKVTVPSQTPLPTITKQTIAATPSPTKVLGENIQNTPITPPAVPVVAPLAPVVPSVLTPGADSIVRVTQPEVIGRAEPLTIVTLYLNGIPTENAAVDVNGMFSLVSAEPWSEGKINVQVSSTARALTSDLSPALAVTVDTVAPTVEVQRSIVLPSYLVSDGYDTVVEVTGQPSSVLLVAGGQAVPLVSRGPVYIGTIQLSSAAVAGTIRVQAVDQGGNQAQNLLVDPSLFTTGVVASTNGPLTSALRLIFFSQSFMAIFLTLLLLVATLNVVIHWRHQHHPTIVASLLVLFLGGTLFLM